MTLGKFCIALLVAASTLFLTIRLSFALTVYKYTDTDGTVCIVQDPNQIPPAYQTKAVKIELEDVKADPLAGLKDLKIKEKGKKQLDRGMKAFSSFLRSRKFVLISYLAGGVILFLVVSLFLKRYAKNPMVRVVIKGIIVTAFMACAYLYYLSYMSQNFGILGQEEKDSRATSIKRGTGKIVTPKEIMGKAKEAADKLNQRTKESEKTRKELDKGTEGK